MASLTDNLMSVLITKSSFTDFFFMFEYFTGESVNLLIYVLDDFTMILCKKNYVFFHS